LTGAAQPSADERELREREALVSRRHQSAALAFLAGGVAHDLNNLLTVIVGSADLLGEDPRIEEEQRAELQAIQRAGERASEITRQLLAYSRREPSVPLDLQLEGSIGELAPLIARMLGPEIRLELAFGPELWPVRLDPLHAEQVITHLALNARQAMPQGGLAQFALNNVTVERLERRGPLMVGAGEYVELCVRDTGIGMSVASIARAFEPFFAAPELPASTDLTLPLVRNLVAHALGHIWIESEPGQGTVFHVLFPRYDERRASAAPALFASGAGSAPASSLDTMGSGARRKRAKRAKRPKAR
jgi:two-component system, cell cycle sensor histidine kinase and response regulator CckA